MKATVRDRRLELTAEQIRLLERYSPKFRQRRMRQPIRASWWRSTFFTGTLKVVGRIYPQNHARPS